MTVYFMFLTALTDLMWQEVPKSSCNICIAFLEDTAHFAVPQPGGTPPAWQEAACPIAFTASWSCRASTEQC